LRAARAATPSRMRETLKRLDDVEGFNLMLLPDHANVGTLNAAARYCVSRRAILIVEPPRATVTPAAIARFIRSLRLKHPENVALYAPWIRILDPLSRRLKSVPPGGSVAGVIARTDAQRGVWKAPAGVGVNGARSLVHLVTDAEQEVMNREGMNSLRTFPGRGVQVWGARTLSPGNEWRYVNVRRLVLFLEQSIERGLSWVVFEPNAEPLWAKVQQAIENFLHRQWRAGAFPGATSKEAFFVRCDRTTMTQRDLDNGRLIAVIGIAALKPAEFIVFRVTRKHVEG